MIGLLLPFSGIMTLVDIGISFVNFILTSQSTVIQCDHYDDDDDLFRIFDYNFSFSFFFNSCKINKLTKPFSKKLHLGRLLFKIYTFHCLCLHFYKAEMPLLYVFS